MIYSMIVWKIELTFDDWRLVENHEDVDIWDVWYVV